MPENFINIRPLIKVDSETRDDLADSVSQVTVRQPLCGMSSAEMQFVNWGVGDSGDVDFYFEDIRFGAAIELYLGDDTDNAVFKGEITGIEERYGNGAPRIVFLAEDKLHHIARKRNNRVFDDMSPDDVISQIASDAGLAADVNISSSRGTFHQMNESDLAFATRLASYYDVAIRYVDDTLRARPEQSGEAITLTSQQNALQIRLLADLNHQHLSTTVNGFNPESAEAVSGNSNQLSESASGTTASDVLAELGWEGDEIIPRPFPADQSAADDFASAGFNKRARRFVHGKLVCTGVSALRSGKQVSLAGVSPRFRGDYQVTDCVHRFDRADGYRTALDLSRPDLMN